MADILHFDYDEALEDMLQVFWRQGFKTTTTKDLAKSANLSEGSIYNSFGSKRAVYLLVLQRYREHHIQFLEKIDRHESPLEGLREYWEKIASFAFDKTRVNGCMIVNATIEECQDEEIKHFIVDVHNASEKRFKRALDRAITVGELSPDTNTKALAQFLLHSSQGIRVLSRVNPSKQKMKNVVDGVMAVLDGNRV
ncbi:MAG: TetR/AcrR family transcriptional repressor of nem operon [Dinoroseobacter sp.]|jgi:TetR/AcrR family transcriptional repressor of nem operon